MNSLPIYAIGGQRFVCCAQNEHVIRTHSKWKEEVIYFNQSLPTSNSIPIVLALLFKIELKSQEKKREWEMKQMVIALIYIIIVPLINFFLFSLFSFKIPKKKLMKISSLLASWSSTALLLFLDPRGDNLYVNFSVACGSIPMMWKKELCGKMKRFS